MIEYINYKDSLIKYDGRIKLFDKDAFDAMEKVCSITSRCLDELVNIIKPGVSTNLIDKFVYEYAIDHKVLPATLNYRGYKYSSCISINHVVCHGMPSEKILKEGDIVNVDVTFILNGWHGDSSRMYPVGKINPAAKKLLKTTYDCLMLAIEQVKPGNNLNDIGKAIEQHAYKNRCSVVTDFCGHGVGQLFHDTPNILHFFSQGNDIVLKQGMIFTIEPMINLGKADVKILSDGWTAVTRDKSLSAQYEHCVGVTQDGCKIFTKSKNDTFFRIGV